MNPAVSILPSVFATSEGCGRSERAQHSGLSLSRPHVPALHENEAYGVIVSSDSRCSIWRFAYWASTSLLLMRKEVLHTCEAESTWPLDPSIDYPRIEKVEELVA